CMASAPTSCSSLSLHDALPISIFLAGCVPSGIWSTVVPEQRCLDVREPSQLCPVAIPPIPEPETVSKLAEPVDPSHLSLDEAIRSEEHTSELQSLAYLVCRLLL